jgi:conjugal transfer/entry exclusion protein
LRTFFNAEKKKIYQRIDNESKATGKARSGAAAARDELQKKVAKLEKELREASSPISDVRRQCSGLLWLTMTLQTREKYARALQDSNEFAARKKLLSDHLKWVQSGKPAMPGQQ